MWLACKHEVSAVDNRCSQPSRSAPECFRLQTRDGEPGVSAVSQRGGQRRRTSKRLATRVSSDRCRGRCSHKLRQGVLHGAAAANRLPVHARRKRFRNPDARAAAVDRTSQSQAALVKQRQQSAHGPGTAASCVMQKKRTFAAGHHKQARCARLGEGVGGPHGLVCCKATEQRSQKSQTPACTAALLLAPQVSASSSIHAQGEAAKVASRRELWCAPSSSGAAAVSAQQRNGAAHRH